MPDILLTLSDVFIRTYEGFLKAALVTIQITAIAIVLGTVFGILFALMKISRSKILRTIANLYITLIRGTPLIVQIMFLYYGIISIIVLSNFWAGAIALGVHNGAYIAEIFRGAIQGVDRGQREASLALGMNRSEAMRRIIFPQALRRAIPPLGNQFIITLKDSSLIYVIGVTELFGLANREAASSFQPFETFLIVGLYYLILVLIFTGLLKWYENKLNVEES